MKNLKKKFQIASIKLQINLKFQKHINSQMYSLDLVIFLVPVICNLQFPLVPVIWILSFFNIFSYLMLFAG